MLEDLHPKFIIEDGNLIISRCNFHKDIVCEEEKVKGGGWFKIKNGEITFYGSSDDFGAASLEDIKKCVEEGRVYSNYTCTHSIINKYNFLYDDLGNITELRKKVDPSK
jgi:hypothetical protein